MPGAHIWHIKVRRAGQADYELAEIQMDRRRPPEVGEFIDVVVNREFIRARIVALNKSASGSTAATYTVLAAEEDDGNPNGHREATQRDFEK
jgi:hypothetical protein